MDRQLADDGDSLKLEDIAGKYMGMRREIWSGLAAQTGEKWSIVELKACCSLETCIGLGADRSFSA
jgi:hypothetical protein